MTEDDGTLSVSAPGKMLIAGEYAVLDGAEAIVAAVDRRAHVWLQPQEGAHVPAEAKAARHAAEQRLRAVDGELALDVSTLRAEGKKLGLGSSAAAAAAAAGLVFAHDDWDLESPATREAVLRVAFEGHRAVAPRGSGADVAASVMGGFIRFRRIGDSVEAYPLQWPERLHVSVLWTHTEVRTSTMLDAVAELQVRDQDGHRLHFDTLREIAGGTVKAVIDRDTWGVVESIRRYGQAMDELGQSAGVGIVDDTLRDIAALAEKHGGAAKPSGAGGGDVALAIFADTAKCADFESSCRARGLTVLSLGLGAYGLARERRGVL